MKKIPILLCLLWALLCVPLSAARCEDWRNLVQPLGTLVAVETAATVNARLGGIPPFESSTNVTTIQTTVPQYFIRFYNPTDPVNPSNPVGSWVMRAATVRGLTPAQVREIFALPSLPTNMTLVLVPAGSLIYTGLAAPIAGWGDGGALQSKLIGPPWVPVDNFFNRQTVTSCILCYRTLAPGSNANRIATYLDARIPTAYSDLETVYLNLDMLYFPALSESFRNALDQIGPSRYNGLAADALETGKAVNDAVDQRISAAFIPEPVRTAAFLQVAGPVFLPEGGNQEEKRHIWARLAGGIQRAGALGFNAVSQGIVIGADWKAGQSTLIGLSFGYIHSIQTWTNGGGGAQTDYARIGTYAAWLKRDFFVQAGLNGGYARSDASRPITFSYLVREADSRPESWEVNPRLRLGYRLPTDVLDAVLTLAVDYVHQYRSSFSETGAGSLNLRVDSVQNRTFRSHFGMDVSKRFIVGEAAVLTPLLQAGWAYDYPLDNRSLTAGLSSQPDDFIVYGDDRPASFLTAGAGIALSAGENVSLVSYYGLEYRRDMTNQRLSLELKYRF
ncbi:MAG: autotransporter outer membrane beta-barrel domain-containing protein [Syntrophaceae bacterium]|nr:autotransporter outer membrane beta-barrel domain-containing protein [Syntrophaceae bacterium]